MDAKLEEIKTLIDESQIPQKDIAKKIGVNHIHLNGVLAKRFNLTERLYVRLKYFLTDKN